MKRKEIEEGIITLFAEMVKDDGLVLINKKFSGADHFGDFEFFINGLKYTLSIIFIKPNFLNVVSYLNISHPKITTLYHTIKADSVMEDFPIASVNINSFMVKKNSKGIYESTDEANLYIDEQPIETQSDIETITQKVLYGKLYSFVKEVIVPKTDSLEKLDYLLNDLPFVNAKDRGFNWSMYASFIPDQVLKGTLLAIYHGRPDKQELFDKYLKHASKSEDGQKYDTMRKAIEQYKHLPVNPEYIPFRAEKKEDRLFGKIGALFRRAK